MNREFSEINIHELQADDLVAKLPGYLATSQRNAELAPADRDRLDRLALSEYQHSLAEFTLANQADPKRVKELWTRFQADAASKKDRKFVDSLKGGVLSRVAVFRALETLGRNPQLSSTEDDTFFAVDLWSDNLPVQVKSLTTGNPRLLEVTGKNISSGDQLYGSFQYFRRQLKKYEQQVRPVAGGYLIAAPRTHFNQGTGEPREELVAFLQEHIGLPARAKRAAA